MSLHPVVDVTVRAYLDAVDAEVPGLVEGLYLTGSAALGDFRPRTSDIDYVAVTKVRPGPAELVALERIHRRLRSRRGPSFDGQYLTWDDLAGDPAQAGPGPYTHEGRFHPARTGPCDPVTWHTLARYAVACRGPAPAQITIHTDPDALAAWVLDNLDSYWRRLLAHASRPFSGWGLASLTPYGTVWIVTGVSRLHYTLATGDICSKEDAARYALTAFPPRWHKVVEEALRIRRADRARPTLPSAILTTMTEARTPVARRRDVLAFADMVIVDAHRHR